MKRHLSLAVLALLGGMTLAACGSDDESSNSTSADSTAASAAQGAEASPDADAAEQAEESTTAEAEPLRVLVTNDDGVGAPGIAALVSALLARTDVAVTVVAPAENQSSTGGSTIAGPRVHTNTTTAGGAPAVAIAGFPADSVIWALDEGGMAQKPDLVISGINLGQNVGPLIEISGTVGAARAAASRGIPALATSLGIGDPMQWETAVNITMQWLDENLADIRADDHDEPGPLWNLNIANCAQSRGIVVVDPAAATDGRNGVVVTCDSTATDPVDDIDALTNGFAPLSELKLD